MGIKANNRFIDKDIDKFPHHYKKFKKSKKEIIMNILMILETAFPPDLRVENEIDALTAVGHKITILAGFRKKVEKIGFYGKARIIRIFIPKFIYKSSIGCLNYPFYFNFWKKEIRRELTENNYGAVHIHDLPLSQVLIDLRNELPKNFKITLDLHENYPDLLKIAKHTKSLLGRFFFDYQQWLTYENKMVKQVDTIITVVEEMKERIEALGVDSAKIVVVSNTFNSSKFTAPIRDKKEDEFILFYGGGVTIDRGLQFVIPALPHLVKLIPNIKLWIVGDGSYLTELKKQVQELQVEHLVKFKGHQPFVELLRFLSQASVALIPHVKSPQTESGLPHKLFQYMITEIPIVASNCLPFIRILQENEAGLIYEYDQAEDFTKVIIELYSDPSLQEKLVSHAKKVLMEKYLWEYDAKRLVKIYQADTSL